MKKEAKREMYLERMEQAEKEIRYAGDRLINAEVGAAVAEEKLDNSLFELVKTYVDSSADPDSTEYVKEVIEKALEMSVSEKEEYANLDDRTRLMLKRYAYRWQYTRCGDIADLIESYIDDNGNVDIRKIFHALMAYTEGYSGEYRVKHDKAVEYVLKQLTGDTEFAAIASYIAHNNFKKRPNDASDFNKLIQACN